MSHVIDWPYSLETWKIKSLYVDEEYQRPLTNLAEKIAREFDPLLYTPPVISVRKGKATGAIVDGQTRIQALKMLAVDASPALVFRGTQRQEADLFARFQSQRRNVTPYQRFRARLVAEDPAALQIAAIVGRYGYEVAETGSTTHPWRVQAIVALERLYKAGRLERILAITAGAWSTSHDTAPYGQGGPLNNETLSGIDHWLQRNPDADDERLARALGGTTPQEITLKASHLRQGRGLGGGSAVYASTVIGDLYRRAGRAGRAA